MKFKGIEISDNPKWGKLVSKVGVDKYPRKVVPISAVSEKRHKV